MGPSASSTSSPEVAGQGGAAASVVFPGRVRALLDGGRPSGSVPPLWDGHAAERVVEVLEKLM